MRGILGFLKSTVIGGLVVLVPVVVLAAVAGWAGEIALKFVVPVFEWLPAKSIGGVSLAVLATLVCVIAGCFIAGLVAETAFIRALSNRADQLALFVPGYALIKHIGANLVGIESKNPVKTVLVRFEASWQFGFLMETRTEGHGSSPPENPAFPTNLPQPAAPVTSATALAATLAAFMLT